MFREKDYMKKRLMMTLSGTVITGFCVGGLQKAGMGVDPFTCLVTGAANVFHSSYSIFYLIITGVLFVSFFFINRKMIGIATLVNLLLTGMAAGSMKGLLDRLISTDSVTARIAIFILSIVIVSFSSSLYYTADLGVSAYDAIAITLADKCHVASFRVCRVSIDLLCCLIGGIFGATLGVGTVITAFLMGPVIQWFSDHISKPFLLS